MAHKGVVAAVLMLATLVAGCGYKAGYTVRDDIDTVAVPVFTNDTFYRNIEIDLTRAVAARIEKETPYRMTDSSVADAILEGRIVNYELAVLQEDQRNTPTQSQVVITVKVTLKNARTGAVLAESLVREYEAFSQPSGQTEAGSRALLFRRTAQRIVETALESEW